MRSYLCILRSYILFVYMVNVCNKYYRIRVASLLYSYFVNGRFFFCILPVLDSVESSLKAFIVKTNNKNAMVRT